MQLYQPSLLLAACGVALAGCAATGADYPTTGPTEPALMENQARMIFLRTGSTIQYSLRKARLSIDGEKVGSLSRKGYVLVDLPAAEHTLEASMWDMPGTCTMTLATQPGAVYFIEVAPRKQSLAGSTAGAIVGTVVTGGHPAGDVAGMIAGGAIESHGRECGGAFSLTLLDEHTAQQRLAGLRESD